MSDPLAALPTLGAGLGYRPSLHDAILRHRDRIDFLEIITDNVMFHPVRQKAVATLCESFPVVLHGLNLSIGSALPPDRAYLDEVKRVSDLARTPFYSDHLALTGVPGLDFGHLSPVWFTEETLRAVIRNVRIVQDHIEKPLVLENITSDLVIPGAEMSEPEFLHRLTEETGCGLLLDVTNLEINAANGRFDAFAALEAFPLDRVVQVHLAGGIWSEDRMIDTHSEPVSEDSWSLFEVVARRAPVRAVLLERDGGFGDPAGLVAEVSRARAIATYPADREGGARH